MPTTTTETAAKNAELSRRILAAAASGMPMNEAIDSVLGEGTYAALAGKLYDGLRAKSAG